MSLVSVIMAVYNGEAYLAESIDSILTQTFSDFELIIVDDGSQDNSAEIIRGYQDRDSRIRFFQLERNMGIADARNRAIAEAIGEYLTIMDCDDISFPERLEKQVDFLQANPDTSVVGVSGQAVGADLAPLFNLNMPQRHCIIVLDMFVGVGLMFQTIMLSIDSLRSVGGYAPGRRTGEERDLTWRLLFEKKQKFANLPQHLLLYRRHELSVSHSQDPMLQAQRDEIRTRMVLQLWGEAPEATLERFYKLRLGGKLSWAERKAAKRDMVRLIESLIDRRLVEPGDKPILVSAMNRRLEGTTPRLWQRFCHWRRHHFQRRYSRRDTTW